MAERLWTARPKRRGTRFRRECETAPYCHGPQSVQPTERHPGRCGVFRSRHRSRSNRSVVNATENSHGRLGEDFVQRLVNLTFRSLLARGNVLDLVRQHDDIRFICAIEDIERIKAAPILPNSPESSTCDFIHFRWPTSTPRMQCHIGSYGIGGRGGRKDDVFVILVAPDHVFCSGALMRWAELLDRAISRFSLRRAGFDRNVRAGGGGTIPGHGPLISRFPAARSDVPASSSHQDHHVSNKSAVDRPSRMASSRDTGSGSCKNSCVARRSLPSRPHQAL